jgi:hypothetical protein
MADVEVVDDTSSGSLCRPPGLALKWQGQSLGPLVLVEPALITKGAKESCLLGTEILSSAMTFVARALLVL